jgi:ABC-type transport system involved in resistance to organic solvents, permease component
MVSAATYIDFLIGLFKSVFFAVIIAGIGCFEGLQTKTGAAAVGESTTSAVVKGIVLIILVDGMFGVIFYYLVAGYQHVVDNTLLTKKYQHVVDTSRPVGVCNQIP